MIATLASPQSMVRLDSLKSLIDSSEGIEKYSLFIELVYAVADRNNDEAVEYAKAANQIAWEIGDSLEITKSGRLEGQILRRLDRAEEAIPILTKVLVLARRNRYVDEEKRILNTLALCFTFLADYDKALAYNFQSLEIREREGDAKEISIALNNIGIVYFKLLNYDEALKFYERALHAKNEVKDRFDLDRLFINMGLCYNQLLDYEKGKEYILEGYKVCGVNCTDAIRIEGEFGLGISFLELGQIEQAEIHFGESYFLSRKIDYKRFQAENALFLGVTALKKGNFNSAIHLFTEAEELSKVSGYSQILIDTYLRIAEVFNSRDDYQNAAFYQAKYIHLKDSIYSQELLRNIARVQTDYEERENIKTIAEKNQILVLNQEVIARQKQVYFFVALVAVLAIMLTYMFLRYSREISRTKQQLSVMNQSLERRVEERTKALQNVNNELDNFIYKTSHDIRGPLASLKGIATVALMELTDSKAQDYLHKLDTSADKLNAILTRLLIVNQINHAVLTPVKISFQEIISEILVYERKKGIPLRMAISHEIEQDINLVSDRHLLRIVLENLIDNAIKYHNSSERVEPFVKINVTKKNREVTIHVIDNGIGIQERNPQKLFQMFVRASERSESGGIGLYLTKLASERIFARVEFSMTQEKLTQFSVTIPEDLSKVLHEKDTEISGNV